MNVVCLDLEGVLVPEIWIAFAEEAGIPELKRTTRDEPDYDKLMKWRLDVLAEHGLGLPDVQATIAKIDPMPGARAFLDELRSLTQVIIISDTFEQFAKPLMEKLGWPTLFCNELVVAEDGTITDFAMRCPETKLQQRFGHDPVFEVRLFVPHHRRHQGRVPGAAGPGNLRRAARRHQGRAVIRTEIWQVFRGFRHRPFEKTPQTRKSKVRGRFGSAERTSRPFLRRKT